MKPTLIAGKGGKGVFFSYHEVREGGSVLPGLEKKTKGKGTK